MDQYYRNNSQSGVMDYNNYFKYNCDGSGAEYHYTSKKDDVTMLPSIHQWFDLDVHQILINSNDFNNVCGVVMENNFYNNNHCNNYNKNYNNKQLTNNEPKFNYKNNKYLEINNNYSNNNVNYNKNNVSNNFYNTSTTTSNFLQSSTTTTTNNNTNYNNNTNNNYNKNSINKKKEEIKKEFKFHQVNQKFDKNKNLKKNNLKFINIDMNNK
ncbi:hypothetical protein ABK040_000524 [Willaertia magna]